MPNIQCRFKAVRSNHGETLPPCRQSPALTDPASSDPRATPMRSNTLQPNAILLPKPQQDLLIRLDHMPREFGLLGRVRAGPRLAEGVADRDINMSSGVNTEMD